MPDPTTAAASVAATVASGAAITLFGVQTGLHSPELLAGFIGGLVAVWTMNAVPDTPGVNFWRISFRRMGFIFTAAVTAGFGTLLAQLLRPDLPAAASVPGAFFLGMGAHWYLPKIARGLGIRFGDGAAGRALPDDPPPPTGGANQ